MTAKKFELKTLSREEWLAMDIPPRSFLAGAAMRKEEEVHYICGNELIYWVVTSKHPDFDDELSYDGED